MYIPNIIQKVQIPIHRVGGGLLNVFDSMGGDPGKPLTDGKSQRDLSSYPASSFYW